ncbi:MAG: electron transfer flavoprotein subunit beta/FixA family protein [Deltaproteobacteria bacterium]|nr:electron transfer flavoprotein subunit beta/FixA family protein [Deltaproteobacteria bacterium]
MKILVTIKRVTDYEAKLQIDSSGNKIKLDGVNMIANPFDEIAVEEALRLKEKHDGEVCVLSIGTADATQQIRAAMAMGADRGILVKTDNPLDCTALSQVIAHVAGEEKPDLVFMGKQAIDDDSHQVAEMVAERMGAPQATQAYKVSVEGDWVTVVREADGGLETVSVKMPCVVTSDLRLNEPRYASLPGIMKAKKKPLDERELSTLGLSIKQSMTIQKLELPPTKTTGEMVPDVQTLVSKLHDVEKVL